MVILLPRQKDTHSYDCSTWTTKVVGGEALTTDGKMNRYLHDWIMRFVAWLCLGCDVHVVSACWDTDDELSMQGMCVCMCACVCGVF